MTIVPFEPIHLLAIAVQLEQRIDRATLQDPKNARELGEAGPTFTLLDGEVPLAIAGVVDRTPGRGVAWAVLSSAALPHFRAVHRGVKRFIDMADYRRLETTIDPRHAASVRWIKRLGFAYEGTMRSYSPDGADMDLYARVRD